MLKYILPTIYLLPLLMHAQPALPPQMADSLWSIWKDATQPDSVRLNAINDYVWRGYLFSQPDSAYYYAQLQFDFANEKGLKVQMADALNTQGISFAIRGNQDRAIGSFMKSLKIKEEVNDQAGVANLLNNIGIIYEDQGNYPKAIETYSRSLEIQQSIGNKKGAANCLNNIGNSYYNQGDFDKAIEHHLSSLKIKEDLNDRKGISESLNNLGLVYGKQKEYTKAIDTFVQSLKIKEEFGDKQAIANSLNNIGFVYLQLRDYNNASSFSARALDLAREVGATFQLRDAARALWLINKGSGNSKKGLEMHELYIQMRDSILSEENKQEVIRQEYKYTYEKLAAADSVANANAVELKNAEIARQQAEIEVKKNQQYVLFGGLGLMIFLAGSAYYRFQSKKKANELLEKTLRDLKSTQSQLIQSEKMASLGELTAGIAHEIQNPLNFVNNFSEVSNELIDEMNDELAKGDVEEAKAISSDIKQNLEKITHHGKRADAIVKGMLAHSRSGKGEKQPTDINALAEEYLKLSYHGLRAKDKSFNADFSTNLDPTLPKVRVIPQDMGRVLLNLINNAFQAASSAALPDRQAGLAKEDSSYNPMVTVSTKKTGNGIEITVSDNGPGIPEAIKEKIFQPFFTTKPTGQGTGLGLSLSYDIVKAHSGELKVESKEGVGSEFIISLSYE